MGEKSLGEVRLSGLLGVGVMAMGVGWILTRDQGRMPPDGIPSQGVQSNVAGAQRDPAAKDTAKGKEIGWIESGMGRISYLWNSLPSIPTNKGPESIVGESARE